MDRIFGALSLLVLACGEDEGPPAPADEFQIVLEDLDGTAYDVFAPSAEAIYVVGGRRGRGMILRYDGTDWVRMDGSGDRTLYAIWGPSDDTLFAVGDDGTILRWDGAFWTADFPGTEATLKGVWGRSDGEVWAVGGSGDGPRGVILRFDGVAWVPDADSGAWDSTLGHVWGDETQTWIVGAAVEGAREGEALVLRREGNIWERMVVGADADLTAIHARDGVAYAVGSDSMGAGVVFEQRADGWRVRAQAPEPLAGVAVGVSEVWIVGAVGYAARMLRSEVDGEVDEVATKTERCLRAAWADEPWGVWAVGGGCPGDSVDLGVVLHFGAPMVGGGPVVNLDRDAGPPDGNVDSDAVVDADVGIGPGEECPSGTGCAPGLQCWFLADVYRFICTHPCADADVCATKFGDACCARPGVQTATTVCMPTKYEACP